MSTSTRSPAVGLDIDAIMGRAQGAAAELRLLSQDAVDRIVTATYQAGFDARVRLAELACAETGLGVVRDKVVKNIVATRFVYEDLRSQRTVGVIHEDAAAGIVEIAQPIGPIFAVTPVTNPTSTVLFKILIALKTRNPIIIRPHGAARDCSIEAARIAYEAAVAAGAPRHAVQWVKRSSEEETLACMADRRTALVLATGSVSLVRAAYRSGTPTIGIGPGNVPAYIGESADFDFAVEEILRSKTFDHGTICASEQAVVVKRPTAERLRRLFVEHGGHFLSRAEIDRVGAVAINAHNRTMSPQVIGQSAERIAAMAGVAVPAGTRVLLAELDTVGHEEPLSLEILAPILAFYVAPDFDGAIETCRRINQCGGLGHTASIFSTNEERIEYFANAMNAGRILVNTGASLGALGGTLNTLPPSLTLACGSGGKNFTTDNISAVHLLNVQRIARRRVHACFDCMHQWVTAPEQTAASVDLACRSIHGPDGTCLAARPPASG